MEQGPQSVEALQAAATELRLAAIARLQLATLALAAVMANHEDSYCPRLTQKDNVGIWEKDEQGGWAFRPGWQLTPCASPDYTWGALNPTRFAVDPNGQLYSAEWNNKHLFTPARVKLDTYTPEGVQWIIDTVEAHTADVIEATMPRSNTGSPQRHLARLILARFPPEPLGPQTDQVVALTRQADTSNADHFVDFGVAS